MEGLIFKSLKMPWIILKRTAVPSSQQEDGTRKIFLIIGSGKAKPVFSCAVYAGPGWAASSLDDRAAGKQRLGTEGCGGLGHLRGKGLGGLNVTDHIFLWECILYISEGLVCLCDVFLQLRKMDINH